jgi:hypothetical protein
MLWALCGVAFSLIYSPSDWQATVGVLMLSQSFTGRLVWKRFRSFKAAIFPDFLSLVLLYQFGTKTLTLLGILTRSLGDYSSTVTASLLMLEGVELEYQFQAELVFLLATLVFTIVWRWQEGEKALALQAEPPSPIAWRAYGVSLLGSFTLSIGGIGDGLGLIQELLHLFAIGALAVLLGGSSPYALGKSKSWMAIIALAPLLILALKSGMKSEVALTFVPILLPIVHRMTLRRFAFLGAFFLTTVLFIFPFSEAWREANWRGEGAEQQADIGDVAANVAALWARDGVLDVAQVSTAKWLSRGSSAEQGGLVMKLAERDSFIGPILIQGLATIFVPRFLWPGKPTYAPGAWFTWYLGGAESPDTATTSTAMMLPTELYWMFGVMGVVLGMGIIAVLNFSVWQYLFIGSRVGIVPMLAMFATLARSSGLEEIHTIYAISSPVILLIYVYIWNKFALIFMPNNRWTSETNRSS